MDYPIFLGDAGNPMSDDFFMEEDNPQECECEESAEFDLLMSRSVEDREELIRELYARFAEE